MFVREDPELVGAYGVVDRDRDVDRIDARIDRLSGETTNHLGCRIVGIARDLSSMLRSDSWILVRTNPGRARRHRRSNLAARIREQRLREATTAIFAVQ